MIEIIGLIIKSIIALYFGIPYGIMQKMIAESENLYLDLLKKSLTGYIFEDTYRPLVYRQQTIKGKIYPYLKKALARFRVELVKKESFDPAVRAVGKDWPAQAQTMIGLKRLDNIQECVLDILEKKIKGDFIETGVWRGGAVIFMRALLKLRNDTKRIVWAADSFEGLPRPDKRHVADSGDTLFTQTTLAVSLDEVKHNFQKYGMLDNQVKFLKGWFSQTLPKAPITKLALLRLDGDMYASTMDALEVLYPKVSQGGYVIVDDWCLPACRQAVEDYRKANKITDTIKKIDWASVYWQKS